MDFPTYKVTERTYRYGVRIPDSNFFDYLVSTYKLNYLFCPGCELSHLDVMLCHFLTVLNCRFNRLRTLNLDYCYSLRFLSCCNNLLKTLDVTPCSDSIRVNRNDNPGLFEIIHQVQQRSI